MTEYTYEGVNECLEIVRVFLHKNEGGRRRKKKTTTTQNPKTVGMREGTEAEDRERERKPKKERCLRSEYTLQLLLMLEFRTG